MKKSHKRIKKDWYLESKRKHDREKYFFYSLIFVAVIMFFFVLYLLVEI